MNNKEFYFESHESGRIERYNIRVSNGEVVFSSLLLNGAPTKHDMHSLETQFANWDKAKKHLRTCLRAKPEMFYEICNMVDKNSESYQTIIKLLKERAHELRKEQKQIKLLISK